jgi:chromosome segregation ATPase
MSDSRLYGHPTQNLVGPSRWARVAGCSFYCADFPASPTFAAPINPHDVTIAQLTRQAQEMQKLIAQLRTSHVEKATTITNLTQENVSLRIMVEELQATSDDPESQKVVNQVLIKENEGLRATVQEMQESLQQLQASSSDVEMQRIQYEDVVRENERLHKQVTEMRESTTQLPWSGGDSELQTLINEDLARENARLRTEAREMQDNVAQLQESTAGFEEQRRLNAELIRDNERLQQSSHAMQTRFETQRREVSQLSREIDRLKTQLRANTSARASGSNDADIPPPAYDEVDLSAI